MFTNPQLSPGDLKVSMVETNGVDEPKLVITNQSSTPTTLDLPPGILQTTGDGAAFVPLTQTGANPTAITSHLDAVGTFIEQMGLAGDPIIGSNPRWWSYMVRQVSTLVHTNNLTDEKAKEYVETQLKAQLPPEKHKQVPAIAVEVLKRVRQADEAAANDSFDPSTLRDLKTTKATVDLKPM